MEYGNAITKDTLRDVLEQTPDTPANRELRSRITQLIAQRTITPVPYTYNAVWNTAGANNNLAAGAVNVVQNINVQADADFLVLYQTYTANQLNAAFLSGTVPIPNISLLMTNTGSGYQYMDQATPIANIFGDGRQPFVLPNPLLWQAKATIQLQATNFDAAAGYNLRLSFHGVKLTPF